MEKKAEDADFSTFFVKIVNALAYVHFFLLYLQTPPVGRQFLSRYARTNFPTFPRNYGRTMQPILQTLVLFQKSVCPVIPPYCLLASELTVSNKAE